jgi:ubiquinone/menaquinone biosynthesis C-methylase UbiE
MLPRRKPLPQTNTLTDYDTNAADFDQFRQPSPIIAQKLVKGLSKGEGPILSIGCGTGQYEAILSKKMRIVGIDKSEGMLRKAKERIDNVVLADMTALPFRKGSFSGAYYVQSLHHVGANLSIDNEQRTTVRITALREASRVVSRGSILLVQRDPTQNQAVWFWKYFPKAVETKMIIQPKISMITSWLENLGFKNVTAEPLHDPMIRGFYEPEAPLDDGFRRSFSEFSYLSPKEMQEGVKKLRQAIQDGSVEEDIVRCKFRFTEIGGTVFVVSGEKI